MDTIAEFQERRAETWRRVRVPIVVIGLAFGVLFLFCEGVLAEPTKQFWFCLAAFVAAAGAIVHVTFTWKRFYRCPACEEPVMNRLSRGGDVPLDPRACPNCGVRLR